jgi:hypothetical protein
MALSRHSARGLRKARKNLSQDSRCPGPYSKGAPPKYKNYSFGQLVRYFAADVELYKQRKMRCFVEHYLSIYLSVCLSVCGSTALVDLGRFFNFLILYTVGRTPWTGDQPVARSHTQDSTIRIYAHRHPCTKWDSNPRSQCSSGQRRFMP